MSDATNCGGSFTEGTACGDCDGCHAEAVTLLHQQIDDRAAYVRKQCAEVKPCPLCRSEQIQLCLDYSNQIKDLAKCRECKCQAPLSAWNNRKDV